MFSVRPKGRCWPVRPRHAQPEDRAAYFPRYGADRCWQLSLAQGIESLLKDPETGKLIEVPGKPGELHHRGPFTFLGYFNAPELSEAAFDTEGLPARAICSRSLAIGSNITVSSAA